MKNEPGALGLIRKFMSWRIKKDAKLEANPSETPKSNQTLGFIRNKHGVAQSMR